jgi:hypothetical protein
MSPLEFEPPLSDDVPRIKVALVGPPKTGKTAGAASAPGPVLYLNAELANRMRFARRTHGDKLRVVQVQGKQTLTDVVFAVYAEDCEFATVAVDSIGELRSLLLKEAASGNGGKMKNKPTLDQYGEVQAIIEWFCSKLCKAPVNVVFVFHSEPIKDETTGEIIHEATTGASKPKLGRTILGWVDIVGYTGAIPQEDGTFEYVAQLVPAKGRQGGDGFNCLADPVTGTRKLDLSEWVEAITAHEGATTNQE